MRYYKRKLFLVIISLFIILGLFSINARGATDLTFTFDNNLLYESSNPIYEHPFNLGNPDENTGFYDALYSFTDEIDGVYGANGTDIEFIDEFEGTFDPVTSIISGIDGHDKVLGITASTSWRGISNNFSEQTIGTIELWIRPAQADRSVLVILKDNSNEFIFPRAEITFESDSQIYVEVASQMSYTANTWYHMRIEFDVSDDWHLWINEISMDGGSGFSWGGSITEVTHLYILPQGPATTVYLDAIGYSWGYTEFYDFTGDSVGSEPSGWISNNDPITYTNITASLDGRTNVLALYDNNYSGKAEISRSLNQSTTQDITFDLATSDNLSLWSLAYIIFKEDGIEIFDIILKFSTLSANTSVGMQTVKASYFSDDTFAVIKIIFNHSANTFDCYVDGILEANDFTYKNNVVTGIDEIKLHTHLESYIEYRFYMDNIILNFEPYVIGTNRLPHWETITTTQQVDKYEFALSDINTFNPVLTDNPNGWTDVESPSGDKVNIADDPMGGPLGYDRVIKIDTDVVNDLRGIKKDNLGITGDFINVSVGMYFSVMDGTINAIDIWLRSSDLTAVTILTITSDLEVFYYDGSSHNLNRSVVANVIFRYEFNLLLDYELDRVYLLYILNGEVQEIYDYPMAATGKDGLRRINIESSNSESEQITWFIDYVGIYSNGISQVIPSEDFGVAPIDFNKANWNYESQNLLTFIGNGTFNLGGFAGGGNGIYGEGKEFYTILDTADYHNTSQFINIYDTFGSDLADPHLLLTVSGRFFDFSYAKIDGVKLVEGVNEYSLIYEYDEINTNESYFYVSGERMYFSLTANDSNEEYIQARFNINDVSSDDYALSFRSDIEGNSDGYFRVNFTTTSNLIPFPLIETTSRFVITQNKTIRDLVILITDNDQETSGDTSGWVSHIRLLSMENIEVSIVTSALLTMMIPLIMILVPTLALASRYGKSMIIPMFIIMSLILTITNIIPMWLFFIVGICSSLFIFLRRGEELV